MEIKVAIPRREAGIFHRKTGIFADDSGNRVAFDGSINESTLGWLYNDEQIAVFNSWEDSKHLEPLSESFELLWENRADTSIVSSHPGSPAQEPD